MWLELTALFSTLSLGVYLYFLVCYQYWKSRGVPYEPPSFPFGNLLAVSRQRVSLSTLFKRIYDKHPHDNVVGIYQFYRPALVLRDPDEIRSFLVKDFAYFHDRGIYSDVQNDPLTGHLFTMEGAKWRNLRAKLTPTFTSGKMKMMFATFAERGGEMRDHLREAAEGNHTIEVKDILAKYTTDVIASCAFGLDTNSMKNPDSEFRTMGRKIFAFSLLRNIRLLCGAFAPRLAACIKCVTIVPRDASDFFRRVVRETIQHRQENHITRNDFMQLLIALKDNKPIHDDDNASTPAPTSHDTDSGLTLDQVAAQAFVFFIAGFETSSTLMSFCLYELSLNQDIQDRLRDEVDKVLEEYGGVVSYDAVQSMHYMDQVIAETLRKYPPVGFLIRKCTRSYRLASRDVTVEEGTTVIVPTLGLHKDCQYYPTPDTFDPERFTAEAKSKRHHFVYLPFGEGPRVCIGSRFGLMQTKVGLTSLLSSYQFNVCKETAIPLELDTKSFIAAAKGGIHLQITNRAFKSSP